MNNRTKELIRYSKGKKTSFVNRRGVYEVHKIKSDGVYAYFGRRDELLYGGIYSRLSYKLRLKHKIKNWKPKYRHDKRKREVTY